MLHPRTREPCPQPPPQMHRVASHTPHSLRPPLRLPQQGCRGRRTGCHEHYAAATPHSQLTTGTPERAARTHQTLTRAQHRTRPSTHAHTAYTPATPLVRRYDTYVTVHGRAGRRRERLRSRRCGRRSPGALGARGPPLHLQSASGAHTRASSSAHMRRLWPSHVQAPWRSHTLRRSVRAQ